jgi:hypothetical protein
MTKRTDPPSYNQLVVVRVIVNAAVADTAKGVAQDIIAAVAEWLDSNAGLPDCATPKEADGWQMAAQILSQEARK